MNIILVEDSAAIRRLLVRHVGAVPGAQVVGEAAGEAEAIALIRRENPDLVLLDLNLAPGNGMNVLRQLRADGQRCKVLVLTHQPLEANRLQCEALGADGFHDKSTDIDVIVAKVRAWIAQGTAVSPAPLPDPDMPSGPMGLLDPVTSLPNRTALLERLHLAIRIAQRDGHSLGVFVVALDGMDAIRGAHGAPRGDELITQAGTRLSTAFSRSDVVARLAADGFAVVVTRIDSEAAAEDVSRKLVTVMEPAFALGASSQPVLCGVGMAMYPQNGVSAQGLLSLADHRARQACAARHPAASASMARPREHDSLLPRLRSAIGTAAIGLAFQPQCRIDNGEISGIEALARWNDPVRGPITPCRFVAMAEENGLIDELSVHLFDSALTQYAAWLKAGLVPPRLALNVSALQVRPALIETWARLLSRHGLSAGNFELEFTETAVLSDGPEVGRTLHTLREMGFALALDDFGIGYSSLSMLQRLPITTLKIDRSFVADIERSPRSAAIVESMVRLAHGLQIRVIAEGVERTEQRDILHRMGCEEMQGYLLAKPLPGTRYATWADQHRASAWTCCNELETNI
jgi:diguanylate cyclase (GGDEF)-like protein